MGGKSRFSIAVARPFARCRRRGQQPMNLDWKLIWIALGLVLIIEGLPYFLFPDRAVAMLRQLEDAGPGTLRLFGFLAMMAGVVFLVVGRWLA